jgi:pimeloyl-ACP methyl ester carboxylesterase
VNAPDPTIRRAVIVIHGVSRNAVDYFDYASANTGGVAGMVTIAPQFATSADNPAAGQLYWGSSWSECAQSSSALAWRIPSCAVLDDLITELYANFKNLSSVVIMGNSAGGQLTTRYAAASPDTRNRYIVSAPSSYLYMTPQRWSVSKNAFVAPTTCSNYNDYKYGYGQLSSNAYMNAVGAPTLTSRYGGAKITYIIGSLDNDPAEPNLDVSCAGLAQGSQRLERMQNFYRYLGTIYGLQAYANKRMEIVDGYAHSARNVLSSVQAKTAIMEGFTTTQSGDLNKDGAVNVMDLSRLLSSWSTADALADLDNNGKVDIFDLSSLLAQWTK